MRHIVAATLVWVMGACTKASGPPPLPPVTSPVGDANTAVAAKTLVVGKTTGVVEVLRDATWVRVAPGEVLRLDDALRTASGATTEVVIEDAARVIVQESSEVSVRELTSTIAKLRLDRGRVGAEVNNPRFTMRVEAKNSKAAAEANAGSFTVFTDGHGLVAVAATAGSVKLSGSGGDALLEAGQQAVVQKDQAPERASIPRSVFLKVAWPDREVTRAQSVAVRGTVAVGSEVVVNGKATRVADDGSFNIKLELTDGRNPITVSAIDVLGRETVDSSHIDVVRGAPQVSVEKDSLWK